MSPLDHALRYVRRGFKVFPLLSGQKAPAVPGGFKAATGDEAQCRRWWTPDGHMGIGIATGDLWVLDIDGEKGRASLEALEEKHERLPETLTCWTGGGGAHFYFAAVPGLRNRAGIRPGIDVRAEGGYVVAPPSIHESGKRYAWLDEQAPILPAPAWLIELVTTRTKPGPRSRVAQSELTPALASETVPAPTPSQTLQEPVQAPEASDPIRDRRAYAKGALRRACRDVEAAAPGTRNDVLNRRAFSLVDFVREGLLERPEVEAALDQAADVAGLAARETRKTLESALRGAVLDPEVASLPLPPLPPPREGAEASDANPKKPQPVVLDNASPLRVAEAFLNARFRDAEGRLLLRRWRQDWYRYEGGAFVVLDEEGLEGAIWNWADHVYIDSDKGPKPYGPNSSKVTNIRRALLGCGVLLDVTAEPPVWVGEGDSPGRLLPMANGLLDMRARQLHPPSPDLFATAAIPVAWTDAALPCPRWLRFLEDVWGSDARSVSLLQEWFGYVLSGETNRQKMMLILGPRRSGKGTIARVLTHLVGARNVSASTLGAMSSRFGLHPLMHKLLAIIPDARLSSRADLAEITQIVLSVVGEDSVLIDRKNKDAFTGRIGARIMVLSNEAPRLEDSSDAIGARLLMLRMEKSFYGAENLNLEEELKTELPGILSWSLDGYARLLREDWSKPTYREDLAEDMRELNSPIQTFIAEQCVLSDDAWCDVKVLFRRYVEWALENGMRPKPSNLFSRDLGAATSLRAARVGSQRVFNGITVRGAAQALDA